MKKYILIASAVILWFACNNKSKGTGKIALKTQKDSFSYALGVYLGTMMHENKIKEVDWKLFEHAAEFVMKNGDSAAQISGEKMGTVLTEYTIEAKYGENRKKGEEFIAKNKSKYKTTTSGLMYKELVKGTDIKPSISDTILINYSGKLVNGEIFDSNEGKEPRKFALNGGAVPGFIEALNMMNVGSKYEVVIPSNLAYGIRGRQVQNPMNGQPMMIMEPFQTLIFQIEIVSIQQ